MGKPRVYNQALYDEIQAFIDSDKCITNADVRRHFKMNGIKLNELHRQGLIKLKPKLSRKLVAIMGNQANRAKKGKILWKGVVPNESQ